MIQYHKFTVIFLLILGSTYAVFAEGISTEMDAAIKKWQSLNILRGYEQSNNLGINNPITRGEIAVVLDRYDSLKNNTKYHGTCTGDMHTGISLYLQDQYGNPISGARIETRKWELNGWQGETVVSNDLGKDGNYNLLSEQAGEFTVFIQKNGYTDYRETISVQENQCHVNTQYRTITLIKK